MNRTMFIGTDLCYSQEFVDDRISELKEKEKEIERLNDIIIELETERDVLKSKLSETKADIHYLLENGESIYMRNKYIRGDKE